MRQSGKSIRAPLKGGKPWRDKTAEQLNAPNTTCHAIYVELILYLAQEMAKKDRILPVPETRMVDLLSGEVGISQQQMKKWFHGLNDDEACKKIDMDLARNGALVVLALVLKADTNGGAEASAYFTNIRTKLGAEPITVPSGLDELKELALSYLVDGVRTQPATRG